MVVVNCLSDTWDSVHQLYLMVSYKPIFYQYNWHEHNCIAYPKLLTKLLELCPEFFCLVIKWLRRCWFYSSAARLPNLLVQLSTDH